MKIGQLIEYNTWEPFFLKNHPQNVLEKLVPDPFLENENWAWSLDQQSKNLYLFFLIVSQVEGYQNT